MNRQPQRLADLLPAVVADLANRHHHTNGEPPAMADTTERRVKDPKDWTADDIVSIIPKVLGDPKAVEACIRLLAVKDPHRAQDVLDAIETGLFLRGQGGAA
jgi:hypothetical protein